MRYYLHVLRVFAVVQNSKLGWEGSRQYVRLHTVGQAKGRPLLILVDP